MALANCRECGGQVSTEAKTCPHCGAGKPTRKPMGCVAVGLLALVVAYAIGQCASRTSAPASQSATAGSSSDTAVGPLAHTPEGEFFGGALSYLKAVNDLGLIVARTEAGLNDGSTTLNNLRDSAQFAERVEGAAYATDYVARTHGRIPRAYQHDADEIARIHGLMSSALDQTVSAAGSPNADGAESATRTFRRAILATKAEVAALDRKLTAYAAAHPNDTVAHQ